MNISDNLKRVRERIDLAVTRSGHPRTIEIVAVTKTHPPTLIEDAFRAGLTSIGENRIQEAGQKFPLLPDLPGLTKRMVGHLQSNKVNKALDLFDTIDSVDTLRLAEKIGKRALVLNRIIPVLLEVNTSGEKAKFGFDPDAIDDMLECCEVKGIQVQGLMTVGPLTANKSRIIKAFTTFRRLRDRLNSGLTINHRQLTILSMGMSSDFEIAIAEGSTMVRLGTVLFGAR